MSGCVRFAEFELDFDAYALWRAGNRVRLEKLPMEVLMLLVSRAGALVDRAEIQASIWGSDVFVERDAAINTAVRKLRRTLGDDPERPRFVETVIGKGYRFVCAVERTQSLVARGTAIAARRLLPRYVIRRGKEEFTLQAGENLLGRDPEAGVYLDHPSVSRRHARITIGPGKTTLEDLASRNGTFLDGRKVSKAVALRHGAVVGLGLVTLTFHARSAPDSTQPITSGHRPEARGPER